MEWDFDRQGCDDYTTISWTVFVGQETTQPWRASLFKGNKCSDAWNGDLSVLLTTHKTSLMKFHW